MTSLGALSDCLEIVSSRLSTYEVAFLYFTGDLVLQRVLSRCVRSFNLRFDPYRRVAWPGHFIPLFPNLIHFSIGDPQDSHGPMVPGVDLRQLPKALRHLGLHIGNAMIGLLNRELDDPRHAFQGSLDVSLLDLNSMFPELTTLHWNNSMRLDEDVSPTLSRPLFSTLPTTLRTLTASLLPFNYGQNLGLLPSTLTNLTIFDCRRLTVGSNPDQPTSSCLSFPPHLRRLELFQVNKVVFPDQWPSELEHLHIDFVQEWKSHTGISDHLRLPLPPSLRSLHLSALKLTIQCTEFETLPVGLVSLKLYGNRFSDSVGLGFSTLPPALEVLHLCTERKDNFQWLLVEKLPSTVREFVMSSPSGAPHVRRGPKHLAVHRTMPDPPQGWDTRQSEATVIDSSIKPIENGLEHPNSVVDMQTGLAQFATLPTSVTRLSLREYIVKVGMRVPIMKGRIPNVTDLSINLIHHTFPMLSTYAHLALTKLTVICPLNTMMSEKDSPEVAQFDLRCFASLKTLDFDLRWIAPTSRTAWFERLPPSLTDLSLVPYFLRGTGHLLMYMPPNFHRLMVESWIAFPRLPRSLTRLFGCFTDLHVEGVFGYLPDRLTEFYSMGTSIIGALGTNLSVSDTFKVLIPVSQLFYLPLSITRLMLPQGCLETWEKTREGQKAKLMLFFASRPQLSHFGFSYRCSYEYFMDDNPNDIHSMPRLDKALDDVNLTPFNHILIRLESSRSKQSPISGSLSPELTAALRGGDCAVRTPIGPHAQEQLQRYIAASEVAMKDPGREGYDWIKRQQDPGSPEEDEPGSAGESFCIQS